MYSVASPLVQEVLVNQAISTLDDEDCHEKLRLRYKDGWTTEYVAALFAKWESSQASVDQQGRITDRARKQVSEQSNAVQVPWGRGVSSARPSSSAPALSSATVVPAPPSATAVAVYTTHSGLSQELIPCLQKLACVTPSSLIQAMRVHKRFGELGMHIYVRTTDLYIK